ncbi:glycosyltransferase family A protein [Cohnella caldifontis]|uniref:glycosyltransferase family A protein n=1 Tax=Cohnella caldifontis TaxID=3027471 RepID=UPI0023EBAFD5|nr:glycosyltransferase family 2 protein [Cohnella sp. YIM B05605]
MSRLEVLCATMHQTDFSKIEEMNIQSDVVFANQHDGHSYNEYRFGQFIARMITTDQRGVGKNRNAALLYAKGDICLFADDDVRYINGYQDLILAAFQEVPDADVLIFNLDSGEVRTQKKNHTIKRIRIWNALKYGAVRIAVKLDSVQKRNIWFTTLFGGGCKYPSGEDSLWLIEAARKGLKIYAHPLVIGTISMQDSTWFKGYDEEYFFGRGAWAQAAMPKTKYAMFFYYILRLRRLSNLSFQTMIRMMCAGAKCFREGVSFGEWYGKSSAKEVNNQGEHS